MWQLGRNIWRTVSQKDDEGEIDPFNHFLWKILLISSVIIFFILYIVMIYE